MDEEEAAAAAEELRLLAAAGDDISLWTLFKTRFLSFPDSICEFGFLVGKLTTFATGATSRGRRQYPFLFLLSWVRAIISRRMRKRRDQM